MFSEPYCMRCKNYIDDNGQKFHCKASREIPREILMGDNDHTKPYPGDNGIMFEPKEGKNDK